MKKSHFRKIRHGFGLLHSSLCPWMISWTAVGSSRVLRSPKLSRFRSTILRSTRRIILPERVFGRRLTNCKNKRENKHTTSLLCYPKCLACTGGVTVTWTQSGLAYLAMRLDTMSLSCWETSSSWASTPCFSTTKAYTPDTTQRGIQDNVRVNW